MSEVSNTINLNAQSVQGNFYTRPFSRAGAVSNVPNCGTSGINSNKINADYFTHTKAVQNAKKNPLLNAIDDCLVRVAPKLYLGKYINETNIKSAAQNNPRISELLASKGLTVNVNIQNVTGKIQSHFLETYNKAKELGSNLPVDEYSSLMQAALLHDIGKAFIPSEILDKPAALTPEEREIVDLHAEIGAEILKAMNLDSKTIEAVKLHHTDCSSVKKQNNAIAQILSVADVYTALRDERPYKKPFTNEDVRNIMQNDSRLNQEYVSNLFFSEDLSNMRNFDIKKTA